MGCCCFKPCFWSRIFMESNYLLICISWIHVAQTLYILLMATRAPLVNSLKQVGSCAEFMHSLYKVASSWLWGGRTRSWDRQSGIISTNKGLSLMRPSMFFSIKWIWHGYLTITVYWRLYALLFICRAWHDKYMLNAYIYTQQKFAVYWILGTELMAVRSWGRRITTREDTAHHREHWTQCLLRGTGFCLSSYVGESHRGMTPPTYRCAQDLAPCKFLLSINICILHILIRCQFMPGPAEITKEKIIFSWGCHPSRRLLEQGDMQAALEKNGLKNLAWWKVCWRLGERWERQKGKRLCEWADIFGKQIVIVAGEQNPCGQVVGAGSRGASRTGSRVWTSPCKAMAIRQSQEWTRPEWDRTSQRGLPAYSYSCFQCFPKMGTIHPIPHAFLPPDFANAHQEGMSISPSLWVTGVLADRIWKRWLYINSRNRF